MDAKLTTARLCPPPGAGWFAGLRAGEPLARRNALCQAACADGSTGLAEGRSVGLAEDSQRRIAAISGLGKGIV